MTARPRLLDLFSGAGGAARGYQQAGFHVIGVDNRFQPRYAGDAFILDDALEYVERHGHEYALIHASPPCQEYSPLRAVTGKHYPDLVAPTRALLQRTGVPWVIENVPGAPLHAPIILCGTMFRLRTYRHRLFECPALALRCSQPEHPRHRVKTTPGKRRSCWMAGLNVTVTGNIGIYMGSEALGIDWMTGKELSQAIPPAYTCWLGGQLLSTLSEREEIYDSARLAI